MSIAKQYETGGTGSDSPLQRARSLGMVRAKKSGPRIAAALTMVVAVVAACLVFVPIQQTVNGYGQVIVYSAMDRPQNIEAQIPGRLAEWRVQEGDTVKKGDTIARLEDIDSKFLDTKQVGRLGEQRAALARQRQRSEGRIKQMEAQRNQLDASREAALAAATQRIRQAKERERATYQALVATRKGGDIARDVARVSAGERVRQIDDRILQAEQALAFAKQNAQTARLQRDRMAELFKEGLRSRRDDELSENDLVRTRTEVERAEAALKIAKRDRVLGNLDQNRTDIEIDRAKAEIERADANLEVSRRDVTNAVFDRTRIEADTAAAINALSGSIESARESLAKIDADRQKLEVEVENVVQRRGQQAVTAPRDGRVVRLLRVGAGETVKAGDVLAMIVPASEDIAVELMINDNDIPLVSEGRQVRLQFAGWPALQFAGWPSVAVGTFAGKVSVIDAVDDGTARYRIIVRPDREQIAATKDEPWPSLSRLRPGAEATGWVLLDTVPLGYELWRQWNAFPPTVKRAPVGEKEKDELKPFKDKDGEKDKPYIPVKGKK
ncbi:MAG: biotin/lipoyl-binding protein [Fibrella sp.]|nr:biotin/lipoyl-binding protein [Armatimonadota bacterium]